jgi:hypothetical protein
VKNLAFGLIVLLAAAASFAKAPLSITVPLTEYRDAAATISSNLTLRVYGGPGNFQVEVTSKRAVRSCHHNLVYQAPHGPDPSGIFPWHIQNQYFPNVRTVPVCGHRLVVEIRVSNPEVAGDGHDAKFTSGTLTATVLSRSAARKRHTAAPN